MPEKTPFYDIHVQAGAKMIDFGGFEMPVQYTGIRNEHMAVRERAGLFDVSHMGEVFITGKNALDTVQYLTVNDASKLYPGRAQYSGMCNELGGMIDDLLVYMVEENEYMLVVNAANRQKDYDWIVANNKFGANIEDRSDDMCLLALQGPESLKIMQPLTGDKDPGEIPFYRFEKGSVAGYGNVIISATGYTGENGFELYFDKNEVDPHTVWNRIMEAGEPYGIEPAGLGARDTLRLEVGLPLYGNDLTEETNPIEAGLGWMAKVDKGEFIGRQALKKVKEDKPARKLTGFVMQSAKKIPRNGYAIYNEQQEEIGFVTSGSQSISLEKGIGMGYVAREYTEPGTPVQVQIRKKAEPAEIKKPPFISR